MLIIKRARVEEGFKDRAFPGTPFAFNPNSGYRPIKNEQLVMWLQLLFHPSKTGAFFSFLTGIQLESSDLAHDQWLVMLALPGRKVQARQHSDEHLFKSPSFHYIDKILKWL
jgi:hypothetical protein